MNRENAPNEIKASSRRPSDSSEIYWMELLWMAIRRMVKSIRVAKSRSSRVIQARRRILSAMKRT